MSTSVIWRRDITQDTHTSTNFEKIVLQILPEIEPATSLSSVEIANRSTTESYLIMYWFVETCFSCHNL